MRPQARRSSGPNALSQALREKHKLLDTITHLEQRLGEKTRTIAHLDRNMRDLHRETTSRIESIRAAAQESDQLKEQLLTVGTQAVADLRLRIEAAEAEKENLAGLVQAREERLVQLQDAWVSGAPDETRAMVEAFSERSLVLVRSLQADLARVQEANRELLAMRTEVEDLRRRNSELQARSERDAATLQELNWGREEDERSVRMAEGGKRAAERRAEEAREIAEQQELVIEKLLRENARHLVDFAPFRRC